MIIKVERNKGGLFESPAEKPFLVLQEQTEWCCLRFSYDMLERKIYERSSENDSPCLYYMELQTSVITPDYRYCPFCGDRVLVTLVEEDSNNDN
jgi:hypothetical protein